MDNFKLRTYDGIAIACYFMIPGLFYTGLSDLVRENNSAAWLALLISFLLMLLLYLIIASLMKKYEGKSIIEITGMILGKPAAFLYAIILGAYLCYFSGIYIREGIEILKIYGFINTPAYIIAGLILLTAVIMNIFGGRAMIKSISFFFIITLLSIVFVMILGIKRYNFDYLFPFFGNGAYDTAVNGLFRTSMFDGVILLTLFAPHFKNSRSLRKTGVLSLIIAGSASILLCLCYVMMFSPSMASIMNSGFVEMGKSSYYNHFFYRFEAILLLFLIFFTLILASLGLFTAQKSISWIMNKKSSKTALLLCCCGIIIFTLIPRSMTDHTQYLFVLRKCSVFFMAGFPLLLFIISKIKDVFHHEKI